LNAIELIQAAAADIGIPVPSAAVAATDVLTRQLVGLLNREGRDLSRRYPWQALRAEATFVAVAAESQGTLATIAPYMRFPINETFWNRTTQEPIAGPLSAPDWQQIQAQVNTSPYPTYMIRGNELLITPAPTAGDNCAFEYVRKTWATDVTGATYKSAVTVDTDVFLLDDELMLLGLKWRWRAAKGFDFSEDFKIYEREIADAIARDGTKRRLSMTAGDTSDVRAKSTSPRRIGL
jgi:hypothetical protein